MARTHRKNRQLVFTADEDKALSPRFRGGKGYGLAVMRALGLPIPPFITISSSAGRAILETGRLPKRLLPQVERGLAHLERETGKQFGGANDSFSVSVRSGAEYSMAGMMDTIMGVDGLDALRDALKKVFHSWNTERAKEYRRIHNVRSDLGTAINIQVLVCGDKNDRSATGVALSHHTFTGDQGLYGEFLINAKGPELVDGVRTPLSIEKLSHWDSNVSSELAGYLETLVEHTGGPVEVEWTVEDGKLWLLQVRSPKLEPEAKAAIAVRGHWNGQWSREDAVAQLSDEEINILLGRKEFDSEAFELARQRQTFSKGRSASSGDVVGEVVYTAYDALTTEADTPVVLARPDTNVDDLPGMHRAVAIITLEGGETCHAAINGRAMNKAVVVGCDKLPPEGALVSVSGSRGLVVGGPVSFASPKQVTRSGKVRMFLRWFEELVREEHGIGFGSECKRLCANEALNDFYLLQSMAHSANSDPDLSCRIGVLRRPMSHELAQTFACYLAIAVASELRHLWDTIFDDGEICGKGVAEKVRRLQELGLEKGQLRGNEYILRNLRERSPEEQTEFFRTAKLLFDHPTIWPTPTNGSIGGVKWARIAEAAEMYLSGQWQNDVFIDRVFNLEHNGGCVFDKHPMVRVRTYKVLIYDQLTAKRHATGTYDLYSRLTRAWSAHGEHMDKFPSDQTQFRSLKRFSSEAEALFAEGFKKGLWERRYTS